VTIAVDTNVLVRYLTWDDLAQARAAARVVEGGETVAVSTIVLCELVWVLKRAYRLGSAEIADAVQYVIESRNVDVDRPAAEAGLHMLHRGGDFADGIIQHDADRAKCSRIATFDRAFADLLGTERAVLLKDASSQLRSD
jgi:predicted nucleic-acid-binding protein